jgi:hypothetical protein
MTTRLGSVTFGNKKPRKAPRQRSASPAAAATTVPPAGAAAPSTADAAQAASPTANTPAQPNLLGFVCPAVVQAMGTSTIPVLLAAWKSLKLVDKKARELKIPMPDLEGREFGAGDEAMHAIAYFDSLGQMCNLRTQSEPIEGWTTDVDAGHSERMITKFWDAQIRHMIYKKHRANNEKPAMMKAITKYSIGGWQLQTSKAANRTLQVPWILKCDTAGTWPFHFEHWLEEKGVKIEDVADTLKSTSKGKIALGALVTNVVSTAMRRIRAIIPGAGLTGGEDDVMSNSEFGSTAGGDDEMSNSASEKSDGTMSNSSAGSQGSNKGKGKRDVKLQHKAFGVAGQKRTPLQMLNAVEENIRWWTPQKGDTGVDDFQLVQYDGGEIHHYTVLSSKVEHGKGIWTVGLIGTEQTRNWDARQMAHALEAAQIDKEGTGNMPSPEKLQGRLKEADDKAQRKLGGKPPHHSDFNAADAGTLARMEKEAGEIQAGSFTGGEAPQQLGYNMRELRSAADFVGVSTVCEHLTEKDFKKENPALTRCFGVLALFLNKRWRGTCVSAFQLFLVAHLAFNRGANDVADELSAAFSLATFVAMTSPSKTGPMSAEKAPPRETLRLEDGALVATPAANARRKPRILGAVHESTQVLMALARIGDVISMFYGARMAERIFGDTNHRVASAMQQNFDDMTQADLILQSSWSALSVNFRSFIHRHASVTPSASLGGVVPKQVWSDFRHVITAGQEASIAKERVERVVEVLETKMAKAELVAAQALSAATKGASGKASQQAPDSGTRRQKQKKRQRNRNRPSQQDEDEEEEEEEAPQQAPVKKGRQGGAGRGTSRQQSGAAKTDRITVKMPAWVTAEVSAATKDKCNGLTFFAARKAWLVETGYDPKQCFMKDKLGIECTNGACPAC